MHISATKISEIVKDGTDIIILTSDMKALDLEMFTFDLGPF